jgi:hypothetical protein
VKRALLLLLTACGEDNRTAPDGDLADATVDALDLVAACPGYDVTVDTIPTSRFRMVATPVSVWAASDDCVDDTTGLSHLAIATSFVKLSTLIEELRARNIQRWWLGAVQLATATAPADSWYWVTGETVDTARWATPAEPDDSGMGETDHAEQFAVIVKTTEGLVDVAGTTTEQALCECDGRAMSAQAQAAFDATRP